MELTDMIHSDIRTVFYNPTKNTALNKFNKDDIVFWIGIEEHNAKREVRYGIVDEQIGDIVDIDMLDIPETRTIDGIPWDDFKNTMVLQKYPKKYKFDTELFHVEDHSDEFNAKVKDFESKRKVPFAESIKDYYDAGLLVKVATKTYGNIEVISEGHGYKLWKNNERPYGVVDRISLHSYSLYRTYKDAKAEADNINAEIMRVASLSDYDLAKEELDDFLGIYQHMCGTPDEIIEKYKNWFLALDNFENVELRKLGGMIQWRYFRNKKWNTITTDCIGNVQSD